MTEKATLEEYRDVISKARSLVIAWRDADARPGGDVDEYAVEWFNRWRDDAVVKYNQLPQHLLPPNPDMLATRLSEIRGINRAMLENCDWGKIAPAAVQPLTVFADTLEAMWSKIPENGTPEAAQAEPLYRVLADEFEPIEARGG